MIQLSRRAVSVFTISVLLVAGCGRPGSSGTTTEAGCEPFAEFSGHDGKTVTVYSPIRDIEADNLVKAWEQFQDCTGIQIDYEGSAEFEKQIEVRVDEGRSPDVAFIPQPGLIAKLARAGKLKPAGAGALANLDKHYPAEWKTYGTVDGEVYAVPLDGNVKSLVWYSPKWFKEKGYTVPQTWDELISLSGRIAREGVKPWCAGIESGEATGWPATDWLEDVLLRTAGPDVYDQWLAHEIPFDDHRVVAALERVGTILRNPAFVNGGYGDVRSIATTAFQEGGLPIVERKCAMHRQASFYTSWWPSTAQLTEDGDIYAFYLPPIDPAAGRPVLGAGVFSVALSDRPEVQAVTAYISTPHFVNSRAKISDTVSPNRSLDPANLKSPILKLSAELLLDENVTFRFDGSDLMPSAVGAGSFWTGMTAWINGADTATVLAEIEASWPA